MRVFEPPQYVPTNIRTCRTVFLAGSIEMGAAKEWQQRVIESLKELAMHDLVVFNPRRKSWDSSWEQTISNPQFYEQVTWELDQIDNSEIIFLYFDPNTKSPISLLELGLVAGSKQKKIVCCPRGFWRRGNVEIICDRYQIKLYDDFDVAVTNLRIELQYGVKGNPEKL